MKTRPFAAALLLAFAPAALAQPAFAQAAAEDPMTSMARARFKEGVQFYDKKEFEQARASFLQAYALKRHPAVLLNLAWSCLKSGHTLEAAKDFKQFLGDGKEITDKQRADATDGLGQATAKLGRIDVQAAAGTEVTIDGGHIGAAPLNDPVLVEAGAHTVKFKGPDGAVETQSVSALAGERAIARFVGTGVAAASAPAPAEVATATGEGPSTATQVERPPPPSASSGNDTAPAPALAPRDFVTSGEASGAGGLFAPPNHLAPVFILGGAAVVSYAVALGMLAVKNAAQNNANTLGGSIADSVPPSQREGICLRPPPNLRQPCSDYVTDNDDVNADATVGNVALGVGVAATLATLIYWAAADKQAAQTTSAVVFAPEMGPRAGGLSLSGTF